MAREIRPLRLRRSHGKGERRPPVLKFGTLPQSRSSSLMDVLARVRSSTLFTITAQ
jgi:hypothetical protein